MSRLYADEETVRRLNAATKLKLLPLPKLPPGLLVAALGRSTEQPVRFELVLVAAPWKTQTVAFRVGPTGWAPKADLLRVSPKEPALTIEAVVPQEWALYQRSGPSPSPPRPGPSTHMDSLWPSE